MQLPIVLCLDCGSKILDDKNMKKFHNHPLKLVNRKNWKCDICLSSHDIALSFFCEKCNFDGCKSCILQAKKDQLNPVKMNDFLENKKEQKNSLIIENNSQKKNKHFNSKDLYNKSIHNYPLCYTIGLSDKCLFCKKKNGTYICQKCNIILCWNCANQIYKRENIKKIHIHPLKLEWHNKYKNNCCNECKRELSDIFLRCICKKCDYDICYDCFNNLIKNKINTYYIINI